MTVLPGVADELRTKLWISETNADIYMDKWDYIHFGTCLLGALYWVKRKKQMKKAGLGRNISVFGSSDSGSDLCCRYFI